MTTIFPLRFEEGHLYVELADGLWLVDTGAHHCTGPDRSVTLLGSSVPCESAYLGMTLEQIAERTGVPFTGLIGHDLLNRFNIVFDVPRHEMTLSADPILHEGTVLPMRVCGIPTVQGTVKGTAYEWWLDTGAQYSYFQPQGVLESFVPKGQASDFFGPIGTFVTDTYEVQVSFGGVQEGLRCGRLPPEIAPMLKHCSGIVGSDLLLGRTVGYFPLQQRLVLGERGRS